MGSNHSRNNDIRELRRRAEESVRDSAPEGPEGTAPLSAEEMRQTLHELRVHQVELEIQNEDLRQTQEELEVARARYFDLYDLAPVGYCTLNEQGVILEANLTAATLFGVPRGALVKQPLTRFILKEDQDTYYLHRKRLFETGKPQTCDLRMVKADGIALWARLEAVAAQNDDNLPVCRVVVSDITQSKQAEKALRQSEVLRAASFYARNLMETCPDPFFAIGAQGVITDVNTAAETITGMGRDRLVGSVFAEHFTEPELARAGYQAVFAEGHVSDYPLAVRNSSGGATELLFNASVYRSEKGEVLGVIAAARDITERKRAEEVRLKGERRLRQTQKAESLGRMAGAIAHLYNNLLSAVLGNLELAIGTVPEGDEILEYLGDANDAAHRAADVSNLMLAYLGQALGKHEPLDLAMACRKGLSALQGIMPREADLRVELPDSGPIVITDAHQFQHVLANLMTNAWEALREKPGSIRLAVKTIRGAEILAMRCFPVDWQPENRLYACLEVTDTGCGMTDRAIEELFDPFFTSKSPGRGLGLPVVLGIMRTHQGGIAVETEAGRGSVFRAFFPVSEEETPGRAAAVPAAPEIDTGGVVLLVEDEPAVRKLARIMLTRLGFAVAEAKDGVEAVAMFRQRQSEISCVLSDVSMPRMDGWETLTALRRLAPGIPVILASGYDRTEIMAGERPEWPQAFLSKPFRPADLQDALREALQPRTDRS